MPIFRQHLILEITRGVKAFLNLEGGIVRAGNPPGQLREGAPQETSGGARGGSKLRRTERRLKDQDRELAELRARLGENGARGVGSVKPENFVWMFSDGRSGSTWLVSMMEDINGYGAWREPNVGTLFGQHYYLWANENQRGTRKYILGSDRESWLRSIRNFVLNEAGARFSDFSADQYLVVKEPFGSIGAPLMMQAMPESRMIFLIRDPRDVVASALDGARQGGWKHKGSTGQEAEGSADANPDAYVTERAKRYLLHVGNSREAYEAHAGPKCLISYEELRADTLGAMRRLYAELRMEADEERLAQVVEQRSWDNIPAERKGAGKFSRKATPGGWREDLTPAQARTVEKITAPILREFYPG